jgi:hypothetical protein
MNLSSICQTGLIKKIVLNNDTGVFVPMKGVRQINSVFVDLDECKEINDTLKGIITKYDLAYGKLDSALKYKKIECLKKDSTITSYDNIVINQEKLIKKNDRKIRLLKIQRNVLVPALGVLILLLFII